MSSIPNEAEDFQEETNPKNDNEPNKREGQDEAAENNSSDPQDDEIIEEAVIDEEWQDSDTNQTEEPNIDPLKPAILAPLANISYEDLGIQLGLQGEKVGKEEQINILIAKREKISQDHQKLMESMTTSLDKYKSSLNLLIDKDLIELLDRVDQQRANSLKRILGHGEALRQIMRHVHDEERKNKILDLSINELDNILDEARNALHVFKNQLSKGFHRRLLDELLNKHLEENKELLVSLLDTHQLEIDLARGYTYGESVRKFLGSNLKD